MNEYEGTNSTSQQSGAVQSDSVQSDSPGKEPAGGWRVQLKKSLAGAGYSEGRAALQFKARPTLQRKGGSGNDVSVAESAFSGGGSSVPHADRVGSAIGADLSGVKAYTGPAAQAACESLGAEAFTYGDKMAFREPSPTPQLVAHESKHAVQQGAAPTNQPALSTAAGASASAMEAEADAAASKV